MKQTISEEFLKMQKLAGLITESEYKEKSIIIENEEAQIYQVADQIANDPEVQAEIEDKLETLTPEQIAQLEKDIQSTIDKLENQSEITAEGDENKLEKAADAIEAAASGLTKSLLIPILPVVIGAGVGSVAAGFGITGLGIAALYGIAKIIRNKK